MGWIQKIKYVFRKDSLKQEKVGKLTLHFNPDHDATVRDYYMYVVGLIRSAASQSRNVGDIVFGSYILYPNKDSRVFRIEFQIEHTLVKPGGRGAEHSPSGAVLIDSTPDQHYLVRVQDEARLNTADTVVEYSLPNLINVKSSAKYSDLSGKMVYIAPLIYSIDAIPGVNGRDLDLITLFGNPEEPRRKQFLEKLQEKNPEACNVNGHFHDVRSIYRRTRVLINVRQTDHHDTLEELRVLPALLSGVVIVSEDVPLRKMVPYHEFILWAPLAEIPRLAQRVLEEYDQIHKSIFGGEKFRKCLTLMAQHNDRAAEQILSYVESI